MATKTTHLELTLPENGEYVDNWDAPINANMELIDDNALAVKEALAGTAGTISQIGGTPGNLVDRLSVGIEDSGALKVDATASYQALAQSSSAPTSGSAESIKRTMDRFAAMEAEQVALRNGTHESRFGLATSQSAIAGLARLADKYSGGPSPAYATALPSPIRGFTPNCVVEGPGSGTPYAPTHITGPVGNVVTIAGGTVYSIDGRYFSVEDDIKIDLTGATASSTQYLFVSKNEADYNSAGSEQWLYTQHKSSFGSSFMVDLRVIPAAVSQRADASTATDPIGGIATSGGSTFSATNSDVSTWGVRAGDILVVTSPASISGEYVIDSISGATTVYIAGTFRAGLTGLTNCTYRIERRTIPAIGYVPSNSDSGRVLIGEAVIDGGGAVSSVTPYAYNGVYDSGWKLFPGTGSFFSNQTHYLGTYPSQVEIWVRDWAASGLSYLNPTLLLSVDAIDPAASVSPATVGDCPFPAFRFSANESIFNLTASNPLGGVIKNVFTDNSGTTIDWDSGSHYYRVILRR